MYFSPFFPSPHSRSCIHAYLSPEHGAFDGEIVRPLSSPSCLVEIKYFTVTENTVNLTLWNSKLLLLIFHPCGENSSMVKHFIYSQQYIRRLLWDYPSLGCLVSLLDPKKAEFPLLYVPTPVIVSLLVHSLLSHHYTFGSLKPIFFTYGEVLFESLSTIIKVHY